MSTYTGTITATGKSEAIRLEKALFRSHPEFRQKTKVHAHVIGPGTMLVTIAGETAMDAEADSVMAAFLSLLSADMARTPERVEPLAATRIEEARELTRGVAVRDDEILPDDTTLRPHRRRPGGGSLHTLRSARHLTRW
jgi:antitoxin PrlF